MTGGQSFKPSSLVMAIDPGPEVSGMVQYDLGAKRLLAFASEMANGALLDLARLWAARGWLAIEQVSSYGMPVGAEVFDTVYWSGRLAQAFGNDAALLLIPRLQVKLALCHDSRAKDANIRQAILDRFGGKARAVGRKHTPGKLYGVSGHAWAALALALTAAEKIAAQGVARR